jgi:hypothetical protein
MVLVEYTLFPGMFDVYYSLTMNKQSLLIKEVIGL